MFCADEIDTKPIKNGNEAVTPTSDEVTSPTQFLPTADRELQDLLKDITGDNKPTPHMFYNQQRVPEFATNYHGVLMDIAKQVAGPERGVDKVDSGLARKYWLEVAMVELRQYLVDPDMAIRITVRLTGIEEFYQRFMSSRPQNEAPKDQLFYFFLYLDSGLLPAEKRGLFNLDVQTEMSMMINYLLHDQGDLKPAFEAAYQYELAHRLIPKLRQADKLAPLMSKLA